MEGLKSTAGPRQFEATAIAKLRARGVPKHVAEAFVKVGIPKSGMYDRLKDQVCKMVYKKYFIERSQRDIDDPLRVGAYIPDVVESRAVRFHCEFQMSDIETAMFSKAFPEFDIVAKGRSYNQHAYYANKRYAECELLVQMVFLDAKKTGFDPRSLVDIGGNGSWHSKRERNYVHCDNPVLSHRDKMRYTVREVFSGGGGVNTCRHKFTECDVKADYAISVHSAYDQSPKALAVGMRKRGIKKLFGVINYIPGVEVKPAGEYVSDGMVMRLIRPARGHASVECGFVHDPSLRYVHRLSVMRRYLSCTQRYDFVEDDGTVSHYTYRIHSVRGNSLIFVIDQSDPGVLINTSTWSPSKKKSYFLTLSALGVRELEVDCEFFDRLVLEAASARNVQGYDIVSLFRYAKSLRQRVSMNGVVLSSGYTFTPEELVHITAAAFATASAYRAESAVFFKKATSQIVSLRGRGFFRDVYEVGISALSKVLLVLPVAALKAARLDVLNEAIKRLVAAGRSITVQVLKPHQDTGILFDPMLFSSRSLVRRVRMQLSHGLPLTPYSRYYSSALLPTKVSTSGGDMSFYSRGMIAYDVRETVKSASSVKPLKLDELLPLGGENWVERARAGYYKQALKLWKLAPSDSSPLVLPNGDRLYRYGLGSVGDGMSVGGELRKFVQNPKACVILRGVGRYVVRVDPPECYATGQCYAFLLFFEHWTQSGEAETVVDHIHGFGGDGDYSSFVDGVAPPGAPSASSSDTVWQSIVSGEDDQATPDVRVFRDPEEGRQFVSDALDRNEPYASGALDPDGLSTPPPESLDGMSELISTVGVLDAQGRATGDEHVSAVEESPTEIPRGVKSVASEDMDSGRDSIREFIRLCEESEKVAIASAKMVFDIAVAAARGDAPARSFKTVAQQHPGDVMMVHWDGIDTLLEYFTKKPLGHMAVSDGRKVFDLGLDMVPAGVYITSDVMKVYNGSVIKDVAVSVLDTPYEPPVTCMDAIAGAGKTYHIYNNAKPGDVVLCETKASLDETADHLKKIPGWMGHAYTIDSYLRNRKVKECNTLWLDESFRLHAGKQRTIFRKLKPVRVQCYGDSKQIQALPYLPMIEFRHAEYPYGRVTVKKDTWRFGADVCYVLSGAPFYPFHALTHVPILRSILKPTQFRQGYLDNRPRGAVLLVYTHTACDDLIAAGIKGVMTIGEAQGKTFDHVMLFRHKDASYPIFNDPFQALVAVTRHRKTFEYVSVSPLESDGSMVLSLVKRALKASEVVLSSHCCPGVKPAIDYRALASREANRRSAGGFGGSLSSVRVPGARHSPSSSASSIEAVPPVSTTAESEWSLFEDD